MNLRTLSDRELLEKTKSCARREREALGSVLHHLMEIERRRLFADLKYTSLFDYVTKELKYSENQAVRRISAMRMMREIPEIETKIQSGELSLTNIGLAQGVFKARAYSTSEKVELLSRLENQSTRKAEEILDVKREIGFSVFDEDLRLKLLRLKGELAHKYPGLSLVRLLHLLCDHALEGAFPGVRGSEMQSGEILPSAPKVKNSSAQEVPVGGFSSVAKARRYIVRRDQGRCTNCGSTHALEVDHIIPKSLGGGDDLANLRLLCRHCNQRAAIVKFGPNKMGRYLK